MAVTHSISLDMRKRTPVALKRIVLRQGETGSQTIKAEITLDGSAYTSSCANVRLDILHSDSTWSRVSAVKSGSTVTCTMPSPALSSAGICQLAHFVFFTGSNLVETTEGFELRIMPAVDVSGSHQEAESYDDLLTKLWEKWDAYEKQAEKQESARVSAENTRKSQESARVSAENTRKANEEQRKADEAARKQAESARANAETSRNGAESSRVTAEVGRATAERSRATEHASLKTASQQATSAANSAASSANSAASRASGAADDATAAAANALNIANSISAARPPSDAEVEELRDANRVLASAVAELQDGYVLLGETAYIPSSRVSSHSGETLRLAKSSVSGEKATLN